MIRRAHMNEHRQVQARQQRKEYHRKHIRLVTNQRDQPRKRRQPDCLTEQHRQQHPQRKTKGEQQHPQQNHKRDRQKHPHIRPQRRADFLFRVRERQHLKPLALLGEGRQRGVDGLDIFFVRFRSTHIRFAHQPHQRAAVVGRDQKILQQRQPVFAIFACRFQLCRAQARDERLHFQRRHG